MKILYLIAEDNPTSAAHSLWNRGDQVTCVTDCREALKKLAAESFGALVIDQEGSDILDFTINARRVRPSVPIFVASVWGPVDLPVALASIRGVCDHISPVSAD